MRRLTTLLVAVGLTLSAAACSDDDADDNDSDGTSSTTAASATTADTGGSPGTTVAGTTAGSPDGSASQGGTLGDGYTISSESAEAVDACLLQWHTLRTAVTTTLNYQSGDVEALLAMCVEADAMVDEDNRGAPNEPLPVHALSGVLGQVLISASNEMRTARDRCATGPCTLDPAQLDTFLVLNRTENDAFSGQPEEPPTVADIEGLVVI